jgi:FAD/FMN-containing dehydrogenase
MTTTAALTFDRDDPGYESARRAAVANARTPDRRPDRIVLVRDADDISAALREAGDRGWRVGIRSGGHSWAGSHLRDGGLLLDVSLLRGFEVDAGARMATAGPGLSGSVFTQALFEHGLAFPTGHCVNPCLGGFILQGGFGWNSRAIGPSCMSVEAMDVVLADGEQTRISETEHPDLFWAARGSGPGFFAVVTRFHLRLHPRPAAQMSSAIVYPPELVDEVMTWAHAVGPDVPATIELMVFMRRELMGHPGPGLMVLAPVLADSPEQAREQLAFLDAAPFRDKAIAEDCNVTTDVRELVQHSAEFYPEGHRYAVDNMWTHASAEELLPGYRRILDTLPDGPSHMMWMNWQPQKGPERPDMAFSLEDETYIALYGVWTDPTQDDRFDRWAEERMRELEPFASGVQLADENLARRPQPFVSAASLARLDAVRERYDPQGRFHTWMGRP